MACELLGPHLGEHRARVGAPFGVGGEQIVGVGAARVGRELEEDLLLGGDVLVQGGVRPAKALRDGLERDLVVGPLGEQLRRGALDLA